MSLSGFDGMFRLSTMSALYTALTHLYQSGFKPCSLGAELGSRAAAS